MDIYTWIVALFNVTGKGLTPFWLTRIVSEAFTPHTVGRAILLLSRAGTSCCYCVQAATTAWTIKIPLNITHKLPNYFST